MGLRFRFESRLGPPCSEILCLGFRAAFEFNSCIPERALWGRNSSKMVGLRL